MTYKYTKCVMKYSSYIIRYILSVVICTYICSDYLLAGLALKPLSRLWALGGLNAGCVGRERLFGSHCEICES